MSTQPDIPGGHPISGSLRRRIMLPLVCGSAILAVLLFFIVRVYATQIAQQGQDNILSASVSSILGAAAIKADRVEVDIPYASFAMLSTPSDDRVFYAIYQDDNFLSGYPGLISAHEFKDSKRDFQTVSFNGEAVRLITANRTLVGAQNHTQIRFALAQTQDALSGTLDRISRNAAIIGFGFFVLTTALSFWVTSATIGQMKRLSISVTRRGPQDLRPFKQAVPVEMLPLVTSLNSLMGRLDHSLRQSEDFIAEAAHRIRTPLATVRSYAEVTLQRVDKKENRTALRAMMRAIDESSRAAGQLLDHAMITFRAEHLERLEIDLAQLTHELVVRLKPIAEMRDIKLCLHCETHVPYAGDPILIQNAVRNLVENALKYAPANSTIDICIETEPNLKIRVSDRGPGFQHDEIETLAKRFERGKNAKGTIGSGLGLTIAKDVARAHGGNLILRNRTGGGGCVTISL